jgi:hypothetical protein
LKQQIVQFPVICKSSLKAIFYSSNITSSLASRPEGDVMITIFCDFRQFSAKKMANFLANFFAENILKIITSVSGEGKSPSCMAQKAFNLKSRDPACPHIGKIRLNWFESILLVIYM